MTTITLSDGTNSVTIAPEYDYKEDDRKVEARHRTRTGSEYVYKFGDYRQFKFSLRYLTQAEKNLLNYWWNNNTELVFGAPGDLGFASGDKIKNITAQDGFPNEVQLSDDGLSMYVLGGAKTIYQYTLSTAFDISTATYAAKSFSTASESPSSGVVGIFIGNSGTKLYAVAEIPTSTVYQYTLGTAWDISTASYDSKSFASPDEGRPQGMFLTSDGGTLFLVGPYTDTVYQYSLSTAFDISTAGTADASFSVTSEATVPTGIWFASDGLSFFIADQTTSAVYQYNLGTAWDVSTAAYADKSISLVPYVGSGGLLRGVSLGNSDAKLYVPETGNDNILQIDLAHDVRIANRAKPIDSPIKPYQSLFEGKLELETFR